MSRSNPIRYLPSDVVQRLTGDVAAPLIERRAAFGLERPAHFVSGPDETRSDSPADFIYRTLERTLECWCE